MQLTGIGDQEMWLLQLWSGTIGAAVAAVLAAIVTVVTLMCSTRHGEKLAREARSHANKLAEAQLKEAKSAREEQVREQRGEAAKSRQFSAIADLVAALEGYERENDEDSYSDEYRRVLRSAVARWQLDLDSEVMKNEIGQWPWLLWQLAGEAHKEPSNRDHEAQRRFAYSCAELAEAAMEWPSASAEKQVTIIRHLSSVRSKAVRREPLSAGLRTAGIL